MRNKTTVIHFWKCKMIQYNRFMQEIWKISSLGVLNHTVCPCGEGNIVEGSIVQEYFPLDRK